MYTRSKGLAIESAGLLNTTSTLDTVNNLSKGNIVEAEVMYLRALERYEEVVGARHPSTLTTVNSLGDLYEKQDKLKEAEEASMLSVK
jgi:hypothetical protein